MPSAFSSNMREITAELKSMDRRCATGVRRAIRVVVTEAGASTTAAIKAKASEQGLVQASAATAMRVSFSVRSGGAKITTNQRRARYARALERGSQGSGGGFNRHPVFGRPVYVNQPTRPYFFGAAEAQEPVSEEKLIAAVEAACVEAGFRL